MSTRVNSNKPTQSMGTGTRVVINRPRIWVEYGGSNKPTSVGMGTYPSG